MKETKIRSIVVDTVTGLLDEMYMTESRRPSHDVWKDWAQTVWKFISDLQNFGFECITVLGDPGSGKSVAMRNLPHNSNIWFNADNKNPTWAGGRNEYGNKDNPRTPYHVIPKSYDEILNHIQGGLKKGMFEDRRYAILTGHTETYKAGNDNKERMQIIGKLSNKMMVERKFETILYAKVIIEDNKPKYVFETQNNGFNTARSPMDLFTDRIENDYKIVIDKLLDY